MTGLVRLRKLMMAAKPAHKMDALLRLFGFRQAKPYERANRVAFKVGARQARNGSTPALRRVVLLSLQNDARLNH